MPIEQTQNQLITDYINNLADSLALLNNEIHEKELAKQAKNLEKLNKNREQEPDLHDPMFIKQFHRDKISPRYDTKTQIKFSKQNVKRQYPISGDPE